MLSSIAKKIIELLNEEEERILRIYGEAGIYSNPFFTAVKHMKGEIRLHCEHNNGFEDDYCVDCELNKRYRSSLYK